MSRATLEERRADIVARGAARKARRREDLRLRDLRARRDRRAARTRVDRRRRTLLRMNAEVRALPPELAQAYREASPEVRVLIRAQARDARVPFVTFEPDIDRVLAWKGAR